MWLYAVVLALSVLVGCLSWRRSDGSMTRYRQYTGAPLVWVLLGGASAGALLAERSGNAGLALALFTGGLIGTGLVQAVLIRRQALAPGRGRDAAR